MGLFDLILLIILFAFIWWGFWSGFIASLGSLIGLIVGVLLASRWYLPFSGWVTPVWMGHTEFGYIISFILLLLLISLLVGIVFQIIDKIYKIFAIVPGLKVLNRLLGAIVGFILGTFAIGTALIFASRFPLTEWFGDAFTSSKFVAYFTNVSGWLSSFFPQAVKGLESILK